MTSFCCIYHQRGTENHNAAGHQGNHSILQGSIKKVSCFFPQGIRTAQFHPRHYGETSRPQSHLSSTKISL